MLRKLGWRASAASSAEMAWDIFPKDAYGLVICDVHLGGHYGLELAQRLQKSNPSLRVIMKSAFRDELERAKIMGFENRLRTPFSLEDFSDLAGHPLKSDVLNLEPLIGRAMDVLYK